MSSKLALSLLILTSFLAVCFTDDAHWPNFSCLPANKSRVQQDSVNLNRMGWHSCLEPYQKWNGRCPNVCMLLNMRILVRKEKDGPFVMNVKKFMSHLAKELGIIKAETPGSNEKKLMDKVQSGMDLCVANHPEYGTLNVKGNPCEPWGNFIRCIDGAIGCPGVIVPKKP